MRHPYLKTGLLGLLLLLAQAPAQAFVGGITVALGRAAGDNEGAVVPFSADAQIETEENNMTSHVFYQPGMVRDEMNMGGMQMTTIQRFDQGKVWVLMGQGMYTERAIGEAKEAPEYKLVERSVEGRETVNGMDTTKYKTIYEGPDGRFGGFTWFTSDNIAVKGFMVSETKGEKQRIRWTLTNVQRGDQPDELFELPAGARPMPSMGGLGGLPGMGGNGRMPGAGAAPAMPGMGNAGATPGQPPAAAGAAGSGDDAAAGQEPGLAEEIATEAAETAEQTTKQETKNAVRDNVSKGLRKLFGR